MREPERQDPERRDSERRDPEREEPGSGKTAELIVSELAAHSPATAADLLDQLPGLEPQRQITDWGRSERLEGLIDRTLYDFLYRYWFRVEVEGIENVPEQGGALLVANHAGMGPPDGVMIAKAIKEEHARARRLHLMIERDLTGVPGVGMLVTKAGAVAAHPANLQRLLYDERELVLMFPEGARAARKPIKERYRLRRFADAGFLDAARSATVPIVPVAVMGAEEAIPVLARWGRMRRLTRLARLPSIPLSPIVPLPAKFRIRFLDPVDPGTVRSRRSTDQLRSLADDIRALIQENLLEMVAERQSVWFG